MLSADRLVTPPEIAASLAATQLFQEIERERIAQLASACLERSVPAGADLFRQGDPSVALHLVVRGQVKVCRSNEAGAPVIIGVIGEGGFVGCAATFARIPYPATATAVEPSQVLSISASEVFSLMAEEPRLGVNALGLVGHRADNLVQRLFEAAAEPVPVRVARALLRLSADETPVRATRQMIAECSGTTLHTVSRFVSSWAASGLVLPGRGQVKIVDRAGLERVAKIAS